MSNGEDRSPHLDDDVEAQGSKLDNEVTDAQSASGTHDVPEAEGQDELSLLRKERDDYLSALQHLQADFENYKKRAQRQSEEYGARAAMSLVTAMLPIFDHLDLAIAHIGVSEESEESKALIAARSSLLDTLAKEGLEKVDAAEVAFNPTVHDAVAHAEGDANEPVVDEVLRAGYRWNGTVVRPAMVRVRG
jgi:molecular chaperone GrpE